MEAEAQGSPMARLTDLGAVWEGWLAAPSGDVTALSMGGLRKRIEVQLPPTTGVKLELDRVARRERDSRRITLPAR